MSRTAVVFAMLMLSSPAFGQEEPASPESQPEPTPDPQPEPPPPAPPPQVVRVPPPAPPAPPPQYAPPPTMARSSGLFGLQLEGAWLSCTGCSSGIDGGGLSVRAGGHIVTSVGLTLTPELMLTVAGYQSAAISFSALVGTRIGFQAGEVATPYLSVHAGYEAITGPCEGNCSISGPGFQVGAGADFWATTNFAIGPVVDLNFGFFQDLTVWQLSVGPSMSWR